MNDNLNSIPTLNLAFIGDGVFDLLVREHLVRGNGGQVGELNQTKVSMVNCKSQADYARAIQPHLTEEESEVYRRGRNAKVNSASKHSTLSDYHAATGLEALFGYLYLKGENERIKELFTLIIESN
jgi:ribonuclease-3 family protein